MVDLEDDAASEDGDDMIDEEEDVCLFLAGLFVHKKENCFNASEQDEEQEEMSLADREEGETLIGPPGEAGESLLCGLYAANVSQGQAIMSPSSGRFTSD